MDRDQPPLRSDFRALYEVPTRWLDNDVYGHINNVNYYSYFDTAIAHYLMREGGLDPWTDPVIGYCVESGCRFRQGARFPDRITAGLKVTRLGRSSATYAIGIFRKRRRARGGRRPLRPRLRRARERATGADPRPPARGLGTALR
jgi:acyl-CoA thioester hydrolase